MESFSCSVRYSLKTKTLMGLVFNEGCWTSKCLGFSCSRAQLETYTVALTFLS